MAAKVSYVGASGAGSVVKLVNQLMVGIHSLAAAEALVLGAKGGADPEMLVEIIQTSWGQSFMMERNGPTIIDRNFSGERAQVRTILKDLNLIQDFARTVGAPIAAGDQAAQVFKQATDKGAGRPRSSRHRDAAGRGGRLPSGANTRHWGQRLRVANPVRGGCGT